MGANWKINIKHEPRCALHIKSELNEKPMKIKHEPGCTAVHDLSDVNDLMTVKADDDGDRNLYHSENIIKTELDDPDGRSDGKRNSKKRVTKFGEQFIYKLLIIL